MFELRARDVVKRFASGGRVVHAVDGVSLTLEEGEAVGLVGESGCGKTTFGLLLLGLLEPSSGMVEWNGVPLARLSKRERMRFRSETAIVFQDPYSSLDPRMSVRRSVEEPLVTHTSLDRRARRRRALELLERVGIDPRRADEHPHEFSGGQRQRIAIARSLALDPKFIVSDEPTSALDVSVQAQVLNLVLELRAELGIGFLFISHNLPVVKLVSDRLLVMYLGKVAESGGAEEIYADPLHPYTKALLASVPKPDPTDRSLDVPIRESEPPSPMAPPPGCRYHTRCPWAMDRCRVEEPLLLARDGRLAACHLLDMPTAREEVRAP